MLKQQKKIVFKEFLKRLPEQDLHRYKGDTGCLYVKMGLTHIFDSSISDQALRLYMVLSAYSRGHNGQFKDEGNGFCYPSQETLAVQMGRTPRTVRRVIKELVDRKMIDEIPTERGNVYAVSNFLSNGYHEIPESVRNSASFFLGNPAYATYSFCDVVGKSSAEIREYFKAMNDKIKSNETNSSNFFPKNSDGKEVDRNQYIDLVYERIRDLTINQLPILKDKQISKAIIKLSSVSNNLKKLYGKKTIDDIRLSAKKIKLEDAIQFIEMNNHRTFLSDTTGHFCPHIIIYKILSAFFESILKENIKENSELEEIKKLNLKILGLINYQIQSSFSKKKIATEKKILPKTKKGGEKQKRFTDSKSVTVVEINKNHVYVDTTISKKYNTACTEIDKSKIVFEIGGDMGKVDDLKHLESQSILKTHESKQRNLKRKIEKNKEELLRQKTKQEEINYTKEQISKLPFQVFAESKKSQIDHMLDQFSGITPQLSGSLEGMPRNSATLFMEYCVLLKKHFNFELNRKPTPKDLKQFKVVSTSYSYHTFLQLMIKTFEMWSILRPNLWFLKEEEMPSISTITTIDKMEKISMIIHSIEKGEFKPTGKKKSSRSKTKTDDLKTCSTEKKTSNPIFKKAHHRAIEHYKKTGEAYRSVIDRFFEEELKRNGL